MSGIFWVLGSVMLVSMSQLLLRHAMVLLPPLTAPCSFILALQQGMPGGTAMLLGLLGYASSMVCWLCGLRHMALSKACALLSFSYILVWGGAIVIPGLCDAFSWRGLAGVGFIMLGVAAIYFPGLFSLRFLSRPEGGR